MMNENKKQELFRMISEKDKLKRLSTVSFEMECEGFWHLTEGSMSKMVQIRQEINQRIGYLENEIKNVLEGLTKEEKKHLEKEYLLVTL